MSIDAIERLMLPLIEPWGGTVPHSASDLVVEPCPVAHARLLTAMWHSRMPRTQVGPWQYAFAARYDGLTYGVALWHNPSARTLPPHWLELRRLAISDDAPRFTATRMLGQMARFFNKECPQRERMISYQDMEVHSGTIYKAAGWEVANITAARTRDRSTHRPDGRIYRNDSNGSAAHSSAKARWEKRLGRPRDWTAA